MKINWSVRFKNPLFIAQAIGAIVAPILVYFNVQVSDITTWQAMFDIITKAIQNPFIVFNIGLAIFNAITDPTTAGISDSERALSYSKPQ